MWCDVVLFSRENGKCIMWQKHCVSPNACRSVCFCMCRMQVWVNHTVLSESILKGSGSDVLTTYIRIQYIILSALSLAISPLCSRYISINSIYLNQCHCVGRVHFHTSSELYFYISRFSILIYTGRSSLFQGTMTCTI